MVNVDMVLSVAIWASGVGMSAVGVEVTIHPPQPEEEKKKWAFRGAFIILGAIFIAASLWQSDRADRETKQANADHVAEQLRNEGNIKYLQGQLDSQNALLKTLAANSTPKQWAAALKAIPSVASPVPIRRPISPTTRFANVSNASLRDMGIKLAQQIREAAHKADQVLTEQPQDAVRVRHAMQEALWEYTSKYQADAIVLREEIMSRLPLIQRLNYEDSLYQYANNATVLEEVATDLESLAKRLPL